MASVVVVDASVVAKWVLNEPGRDRALRLLDAYQSGRFLLIAPALLEIEVASVVAKQYRTGGLNARQARAAFDFLGEVMPVLIEGRELVESAFDLSLAHGVTVYDSLYLALAIFRGISFYTADSRFYSAVARGYPFVRLLGEELPD